MNLEGMGWRTPDDFYDAFLKAVGAPEWHGRNFNALRDSIAGGHINAVELPYRIHVFGFDRMAPEAGQIVKDFSDLIREIHSEGYEVDVVIHP